MDDMDAPNTPYRVHRCSKCPGDTEYYCVSCPCDLCPQCKEHHLTNIKTIDHNVVLYNERVKYTSKEESSNGHNCIHYRKHERHNTLDVETVSEIKQHRCREKIHSIRSEALFNSLVHLTEIKADVKTCHKEFSCYQSEFITKARRMTGLINDALNDLNVTLFCDFDIKQKIKIRRLQRCEHRYEHSASRPLQFLLSIKTALPQIDDFKLNTSQLSMNESFNKEAVREILNEVHITEKGKRSLEIQRLLKLMPGPELYQHFSMTDVDHCYHISLVKPDKIWVSGTHDDLILQNTAGDSLHLLKNLGTNLYGIHTVNNEGDLIYIDSDHSIKKLSRDMKKTSLFIGETDSIFPPRCVYWSRYTCDLLIGNDRKVTRYNQAGQHKQTIQYIKGLEQHDNTRTELYRKPRYITENNNGDVVVSDDNFVSGAVVVTDRKGRYRFSYTGQTLGLGLQPRGICTDALSHILLCDLRTKSIHMLDKDGQFLSYLLTRSSGVLSPFSLSYDVSSHRLWVGSDKNNKLNVYGYYDRQITPPDQQQITAVATESRIEIRQPKTEIGQIIEHNRSLPSLNLSPTRSRLTVQCGCFHISCVNSHRLWVSDRRKAILINKKGKTKYDLKNFKNGLYGFHTVNSDGELIYIDMDFDIKKLSKNRKTAITFIKKTETDWIPMCVYCSPSSGDLLVGVHTRNSTEDKVTRYNKSGQKMQTLEHEIEGLQLYHEPHYITENNNGDVVVSDSSAVVVTERGGRHRFSYTGNPPVSGFHPYGVCTDALSHILVCDDRTNTVQMLDKDGHFLSNLLTKSEYTDRPRSLSYDAKTNRLWVGSEVDNMLCVYTYSLKQDGLADETEECSYDDDALSCSNTDRK